MHIARGRLDQAESQASVEPPPYQKPSVCCLSLLCADIVLTTHKGSEIITWYMAREEAGDTLHPCTRERVYA
jgi:hypothetical protein